MHGFSTRVSRRTGMVVLAVAAGLALTGDASSNPIATGDGGRVSAASYMVTLRPGRTIRLTAVEVDQGRSTRQVRMKVFDGQRRLVRDVSEFVSPTRAASVDVVKPPPGSGDPTPLPLRAEFEFDCDDDLDSGLVTAIEVFNTVTGNIETTSACGCPCCGPPLPPGVAADCGGGWRVAGSFTAP
jgi:hypothetical protein